MSEIINLFSSAVILNIITFDIDSVKDLKDDEFLRILIVDNRPLIGQNAITLYIKNLSNGSCTFNLKNSQDGKCQPFFHSNKITWLNYFCRNRF